MADISTHEYFEFWLVPLHYAVFLGIQYSFFFHYSNKGSSRGFHLVLPFTVALNQRVRDNMWILIVVVSITIIHSKSEKIFIGFIDKTIELTLVKK